MLNAVDRFSVGSGVKEMPYIPSVINTFAP
jgi:hypothetical protein